MPRAETEAVEEVPMEEAEPVEAEPVEDAEHSFEMLLTTDDPSHEQPSSSHERNQKHCMAPMQASATTLHSLALEFYHNIFCSGY